MNGKDQNVLNGKERGAQPWKQEGFTISDFAISLFHSQKNKRFAQKTKERIPNIAFMLLIHTCLVGLREFW